MTEVEKKRKACERAKAWRLANPERERMNKKRYAQENKTRVAAYKARWAQENDEILKQRYKTWYANNRELAIARTHTWKLENPARYNENQARYRRDFSVKKCALAQARRAGTPKATPKWGNPFFISEIYSLARLRSKMTGIKWHVDHIVPLKNKIVCGLHVETNMRVVPGKENLVKSNRHWPDMP